MKRGFFYLGNIVLVFIFFAPFYWTLISSLKPRSALLRYPPKFFTTDLSFSSFKRLFTAGNGVFSFFALNSVIVSIFSVIVVSLISILAGYALSKLRFRGINFIFVALLAIIMVPFQALLVPLYSLVHQLGLLDTKIALILIYSTYFMPFGIFMMKNSFESVPDSIRESALLDGATELKVLFKVFLPLAWPGVMTTVVYVFMQAWNDFIIALVFTTSRSAKTIQVGLMNFATNRFYQDWGMINAGAVVTMLPILLLFVFLQRYFVKGMVSGAVK